MANQVKTVFSVDTGAAIRAIDAYEKRLRLVTDLESKIGTKVASGGSKASGGGDSAMKAAMADIAKMQRERDRMEREATKAVEREAKLQAQARIREAKRSANEMIAELRRIEKEKDLKQAMSGTGTPSVFSGLGGWIAGAVSTAALISAIKTTTAAVKENEMANRALAASAIEAGKSYSALSDSAKKFGDAALISESAAARSTAQLQRLLTLAGSPDQLEKYQKGFLDLAAARGVAFDELDTLFQGIIAGTDDALNRFGKQDPSKLAEQYAKSLGKSVDQLTEQEKILSRLKAFDTDFGLFNGANEDRVKSFGGSVDRLNKSIDDIITNFGRWATQSRVTRDNLQFLNNLTGGANLASKDRMSAMFKAGMTNEEILKALGGGKVSLYDRTVSAGTYLLGSGVLPAMFGLRPQMPEEIRRSEDSSILSQIAADRRVYENQLKSSAQKTSPVADRLEAELKAAEGRRQLQDNLAKAEQERLQKIKDAMRSVRDIISGIAGQRNPFVSVFENAYQSLVKLRELTKNLGGDIRSAAFGAIERQSRLAYQDSRLSNILAQQGLLSEAQTFREGVDLTTLTDEQRRAQALDALQRQFTAIGAYRAGYGFLGAEERQALDRQIIDLTRGFNPAELDSRTRELAASAREREAARLSRQDQEARDTFRNLNKILSADGIKVLLGDGEQIVRIVNEAPESAAVTRKPTQASTIARYGI